MPLSVLEVSIRAGASLPDSLPRLERGKHLPNELRASTMEAASWLAAERWSTTPRSVNRVIAQVAQVAGDQVGDEQRQTLWPVILASIGTGRRQNLLMSYWLRQCRRQAMDVFGPNHMLEVWEALLAEHARRTGKSPIELGTVCVSSAAAPTRESRAEDE